MCKVHHLLPEVKTSDYSLRERDHHYELPSWHLLSAVCSNYVTFSCFATVVMLFCALLHVRLLRAIIKDTYIHTYNLPDVSSLNFYRATLCYLICIRHFVAFINIFHHPNDTPLTAIFQDNPGRLILECLQCGCYCSEGWWRLW